MNKILAIVLREYLTKVRKKSFIILTILMPVFLLGLMIVPYLMTQIRTTVSEIAVLDETGLFLNNLENTSRYNITYIDGELEEIKNDFKNNFDAFLHIPNFNLQYPGGVALFAEKQIGVSTIAQLERRIEYITERARFENAGIDKDLIERLKTTIRIETVIITESGERAGNNAIATLLGFVMGFIMYFGVFAYGSMVLASIIEEKKNRIIEILLSSVRPFEIMIGKIMGIAAVALTQLLIWAVLGTVLFTLFTVGMLPFMPDPNANIDVAMEMQANMPGSNNIATQLMNFLHEPGAIHLPSIAFIFVFYFVFAYLFYAALYAALGALSDDEGQAQQFSLVIGIPIILSFFIMMNVIEDPHSQIAFWASIIPMSSPIVMLARIPFNVPMWQIILSSVVLVISFIAATWMSGKIYKAAILLYGKKITWKDLKRFIVN